MCFYFSEPSRGPSITSVTDVTATSINIIWEKLSHDDANGVIKKYEVCYKASVTSTDIDCNLKKSVNNGDTKEVVLGGLNEATTYNVAIKAATSQGFGNLGTITTKKTLEASKYFMLVYHRGTSVCKAVTRKLIEGYIFIYSCSPRRVSFQLKFKSINLKKICRAEHGNMNMPPPPIIVLVTAI